MKRPFFIVLGIGLLSLAGFAAEPNKVPARPTLIAPGAGALIPFTNRVNFVWSPAKRALKYTVFVGKDGKTFRNATVWGASRTNLAVSAPFRAGVYTWMAMGRNATGPGPWSTTVTFRVSERMMSPGGWERLAVTNPPVFRWENTPGATFYQARIEVYKAPAELTNPTNANGRYRILYEGAAPRDGAGNWAPSSLVFQAASYRWQVREKVKGTWAPWSTPSYFRVDVPSPAIPGAPRSGAVTTTRPTFRWKAGPKLPNVYFEIRVWKDGVVRNSYSGLPGSPFETPVGYELPGAGRMSWQIRAFEVFPGNIVRHGVWSRQVPFTVK